MKRIAVAIDFDEEIWDILGIAGELAEKLPAELHVVHFYPPDPDMMISPYTYPALITDETPEEHERELREQEHELNGMVEKLRERGIETTGYMKPENKEVAKAVVQFAREIGAGLIITGSHKPGRMERMIIGSTAESVLRLSGIPILVVPRKGHEDDD